jgi:hypothetical protein
LISAEDVEKTATEVLNRMVEDKEDTDAIEKLEDEYSPS